MGSFPGRNMYLQSLVNLIEFVFYLVFRVYSYLRLKRPSSLFAGLIVILSCGVVLLGVLSS